MCARAFPLRAFHEPAEKLVKDLSIHMAISIEGEMVRESYTIEAMVCGYHVHKKIWHAAVEEELSCVRVREVENHRDRAKCANQLWPRPLPIARMWS